MNVSHAPEASATVLVADPDLRWSDAYVELLPLHETEVVRVFDGRDALVKALAHPFGLIIANTHLPLIDGYALCRILRSDLATERRPIMLLTWDGRSAARDFAAQVGADALLVKPIDPKVLRTEAQRLILRSHGLRDRSDGIRINGKVQLNIGTTRGVR